MMFFTMFHVKHQRIIKAPEACSKRVHLHYKTRFLTQSDSKNKSNPQIKTKKHKRKQKKTPTNPQQKQYSKIQQYSQIGLKLIQPRILAP